MPCATRPAGLEPATYGLEVRCSIQLSYGRSKARALGPSIHENLTGDVLRPNARPLNVLCLGDATIGRSQLRQSGLTSPPPLPSVPVPTMSNRRNVTIARPSTAAPVRYHDTLFKSSAVTLLSGMRSVQPSPSNPTSVTESIQVADRITSPASRLTISPSSLVML